MYWARQQWKWHQVQLFIKTKCQNTEVKAHASSLIHSYARIPVLRCILQSPLTVNCRNKDRWPPLGLFGLASYIHNWSPFCDIRGISALQHFQYAPPWWLIFNASGTRGWNCKLLSLLATLSIQHWTERLARSHCDQPSPPLWHGL